MSHSNVIIEVGSNEQEALSEPAVDVLPSHRSRLISALWSDRIAAEFDSQLDLGQGRISSFIGSGNPVQSITFTRGLIRTGHNAFCP